MYDSTISEDFEEFTFRRVEFLGEDSSAEYRNLEKEARELLRAFIDKLDEPLRAEYNKVEEALNAEGLEYALMAYKRGLADGMQLPGVIQPKQAI